MYKILEKRVLTPVTKKFVVAAPMIAKKAEPGQFVIVKHGDRGERIPLTIADFDRSKGTVTIVFQEVGKTTKDLGLLNEGDSIQDVVGPLGVPAELPESGCVACVAGGVGVAPTYPKAKAMHDKGIRVVSIVGARSSDLIILEEEMKSVSDEFHVCTDDGSRGMHGFPAQKLKELIERGVKFDEVIIIGPLPMMAATVEITRPLGIRTWVSMNPIMVDGTGMCGACRVTVGGKTRFCCVDGPMFDGHLVDFKEAMRRSQIYVEEERAAIKAHHSGCACGGDR